MRVRYDKDHQRYPVKIWATDLEPQAEAQVMNLAQMPFIHNHVAVMPDAHHGRGSTVGTVIATRGAIIPAAVGVDIGCGMRAQWLPNVLVAPSGMKWIRDKIEASIPVGFKGNLEPDPLANDFFALQLGGDTSPVMSTSERAKALVQLGSLGGGNHFIELCTEGDDDDNGLWIVLHSGSRNIGKVLAERHIERAKGLMKQYFIDLPDPDLAYFAQETPEFNAYMADLLWAQRYARLNREIMLNRVGAILTNNPQWHLGTEHLGTEYPPYIDCHHNYTARENHHNQNVWVTRKGAISAREGQLGIIPGSMGTCSYIVEGLGNPESFQSCSHGAGRRMSRAEARRRFTCDDLALQTTGVECKKDDSVLDEIPASYKDIDVVMSNQADLVSVKHKLKQFLCVKG